jgi:hypothetical protein
MNELLEMSFRLIFRFLFLITIKLPLALLIYGFVMGGLTYGFLFMIGYFNM